MADDFSLPAGYPFAERVPRKGASCATCEYLVNGACTNEYYVAEHGSGELGAKPKRWCCMAWTPEGGR